MNTQNEIVDTLNPHAVIFDLDGTLIDNNRYHLQTWREYLKNIGKNISDEEYNRHINGRTNKDAIQFIYGSDLTDEQINGYTLEKEELYRQIYKAHIKPVEGLLSFLELLHSKNIPMAIATSGIEPNIEFMFEHIPIRQYFKVIVNSAHIKNGKPHPEIYLKTAELLKVKADKCLVFEDAVVGIESAKKAGMEVIAIATTHPREELSEADFITDNFNFENLTQHSKLQSQ